MQFNTPIAFFIYNRPDIAQKVFEEIKKIEPKQLFIIADGAKDTGDELLVNRAREITQKINWDCEVSINFSKKNLGCTDRIISGLNWVFECVDSAIILEDDCLPHPSFFNFCKELLEKYKGDEQIMHISGFNLMENSPIDESYFFSKFILPPWGWATWKRAWQHYNPNRDTWQQIKTWAYQNFSQEYFHDWTGMFDGARVRKTTWDTPWNVDVWSKKALGIIPKHNLVKNIGFGNKATYTKNQNSKAASIKVSEMIFPLIHSQKKNTSFEKELEQLFIEEVRDHLNK